MFIPDPTSTIPDLGSRVDKIPNLSIFNPKSENLILSSQKFGFCSIPDPDSGVKKAPNPGSATLLIYQDPSDFKVPVRNAF
jgi:hypothetical protein